MEFSPPPTIIPPRFDKKFLKELHFMLDDLYNAFGWIGTPEYLDSERIKAIREVQEIIELLMQDKKIIK